MDLGVNGFRTFPHVILPNIATALLAIGMLAFPLSFDEAIVTAFAAGQQTTLPIRMLSELVRPRHRQVTNVIAVFVIAMALLPILVAYRMTRGTDHRWRSIMRPSARPTRDIRSCSVNGSRGHLPQRPPRLSPASCAMRSISAGHS